MPRRVRTASRLHPVKTGIAHEDGTEGGVESSTPANGQVTLGEAEAEAEANASPISEPFPLLTDPRLDTKQAEEVALIKKSGLFDEGFYLNHYPDVAQENVDPVVHYVLYGANEDRKPNRRFVTSRYRDQNASLKASGQNPLAHFILSGQDDDLFEKGLLSNFDIAAIRRGVRRLKGLSIYSARHYLEMNSDIRNSPFLPHEHAFLYGFAEGRSVLNPMVVATELGRLNRFVQQGAPVEASRLPVGHPTASLDIPVGVYYNSLGNGFIKEIGEDLVRSLGAMGFQASLLDEHSDMHNLPEISIIVAPHEFLQLGKGREWATTHVIQKSFMFNTEQIQTLWFERGLPFMLMSRGVIDISPQGACMFHQSGVPALHFNPDILMDTDATDTLLSPEDSDHPLVRVLPKEARAVADPSVPFASRTIDIAFFGSSSRHRDIFFSRNAKCLAEHQCFLYYRRFDSPQMASKRDGILPRLASHVSRHSKISLNVHRDEYAFFEWHRIVKLAMAAGSLVVSEPCLAHPVFKPGTHFFEESSRHMADLLDWLLRSADGRIRAETVRRAALSALHDPLERELARLSLKHFLMSGVGVQ